MATITFDTLKFVERLKAEGDTVTYIRLTSSNHNNVGPEDLGTVLNVLVPGARP